MVRPGDVIENQVSGERFTFLKTAGETNGELLQFELALRPGGRVPVDHIHTLQEERFEVLSGTARFRVAETARDLSQGEYVVVAPGTAHGLRNETDEEARVLVEFRPAMDIETLFEMLGALAREGKVDRRGVPNFLWGAVLAHQLQSETYLAGLPVGLRRAGIVLLAPLGRLLGYKAREPEYGGPS